jgi:tetratricopeptide (TPR) repeat protein
MMKRTIWVWVCVMCLAVSGARAADTAVLLEKGVYAEETKGQLDEAMGYYEQIVKDAQASRHTVAQATYRLGMCYLKKGQKDKADEVLARLVKDYAEEKDLVAKANKQLARPLEIQPAPWIDGEEMRLSIKAATGMEVGSMTYMARLIEEHGRKLWEIKETVVTMGTTQMQAPTINPARSCSRSRGKTSRLRKRWPWPRRFMTTSRPSNSSGACR